MEEQAEVMDAEIKPIEGAGDVPASDKDIKSILTDALEGDKSGTPQVQPAPVVEGAEQSQIETPFLELVNGETKLPFKSEEDFMKFLESNQVLKDGWLRQSDYTRKTQELAQEREQLEQSRSEQEKSWGEVKPDGQSMKSFQNLWSVYNKAEPSLQDAIQKFVSDINLIAKGQEPVGPIKSMFGASQPNESGNQNPEIRSLNSKIVALEQQLSKFQNQTERERQTILAKEQEKSRVEAEKSVDSWLEAKAKAKVVVQQDELLAMADLMSIVDEKGHPKLSLDEAHNMALAKLGRLQGSVAKQVINGANKLNKKAPLAPGSRGNATQDPDAKTIKGILSQGLKELSD